MHSIELKNVTKKVKSWKESSTILENINLYLEGGHIYGIIGKNGSGKTMLLRALSGLIQVEGAIHYDGAEEKNCEDLHSRIGVVIENASMYQNMTGLQNLMLLSRINQRADENEIRQAIERVGLNPDDKKIVKKYSLGMKQRLAIAQAIMERPDYLLLDEPTNALDREGIALVHAIIREEAQRGTVVLIVSHSREDISLLCDTVYRMENGRIVSEEFENYEG